MFGNVRQKIQICALLFLVVTTQSMAEPSKYKKRQPVKRFDLMQNYIQLQNPVNFVDLPIYSGQKKFVNGYFLPEQNGVSACQMTFYAAEEPQTILNFYKDALACNRWQITHVAGTHICASHTDGRMCTINVTQSKLCNIKSKYTIAYRQLTRQH